MESKFKIGDIVRVKTWEEMEETCGYKNKDRLRPKGEAVDFIFNMAHMCNEVSVITRIEYYDQDCLMYFLPDIDPEERWIFCEWMFELAVQPDAEEFQNEEFFDLISKA